jgi:diguanylate cyclase (GGDEF)-like protein
MLFLPHEILILSVVAVALASALTARLVVGAKNQHIRDLERESSQRARRLEQQSRIAEDLASRCASAEDTVARLQRSIVEMPEIAQRLSGSRDVREIPGSALDLIQEIFDPAYSVFYRATREDLVAVACRGRSEYRVGHRVSWGEGVVGWAAVKQLAFTAEDAALESGLVRSRNLSKGMPQQGFSLCLPIVNGERTIGVILIGTSQRAFPHQREVGRTIALITSVAITSALVLKQQRLLAETDGLTGLLNKTSVLRRLRDRIAGEEVGKAQLSVFLFDIDHFKHYNDANGHLPGDELLKSLSALLKESIREGELVGRYGGEEFLLVMPQIDKEGGLRAAERIRSLIARQPFPFQESQPGGSVTISGGVASWPQDGDELETLLRHADEALYAAKRAGRDRVFAYSAPELAMASPPACDPAEKERQGGRRPPRSEPGGERSS